MSKGQRGPRTACAWAGALALLSLGAHAALPPDDLAMKTLSLPKATPHWLWVSEFVFAHIVDSHAHLVDGDTGRYLGVLATGYGFMSVLLPRDGHVIYAPETYFSRGTRGARTDVITLYDPATLAPVADGEIAIPAKRSSNLPMAANAALTDDDRFLLVYNFNPAQSVSVVDTTSRKFAGEIETAGCALVYPTGPRTFFMVCGDGGLLSVRLDEAGAAAEKLRVDPVFDLAKDPVTEKAVRFADEWLFVSYDGWVHPLKHSGARYSAEPRWSLVSPAERAAGWRPGGIQCFAADVGHHRLYAIMHRGDRATHKDPGKDIWVYDIDRQKSVRHIAAKHLATSIQVSRDQAPLLYSAFVESGEIDVYDALTGQHLRSIKDVGSQPMLLVTP